MGTAGWPVKIFTRVIWSLYNQSWQLSPSSLSTGLVPRWKSEKDIVRIWSFEICGRYRQAGFRIRICIWVKSWIRIRIKLNSGAFEVQNRDVNAQREAWRFKMEAWRFVECRGVVEDSLHLDEDPDPYGSDKLDPEPHYSDAVPKPCRKVWTYLVTGPDIDLNL